jgi:molybdate transport system ATP-binding protein
LNESDQILEIQLSHQIHRGLALDVSLRLQNEIGVIFGPSGAGKSTLLRLIAGLIRPDRGSIQLDQRMLFDSTIKLSVRLRNRRIGLIFQDDLLFPHLTVEGNVRFGLISWAPKEAKKRLSEVSDLCGIGPLLHRDPATLSGGERQRVGLARALAPRPRLLLCDEPVSALDRDARLLMVERIKKIQRAESIPVLYVTHSTDEAIALGDRLFLLSSGKFIDQGPPLEVLSSRSSTETIRTRNLFEAIIECNGLDFDATTLRIPGGPALIVPHREGRVGDRVFVAIDADEIVLGVGPVGTLSARNLIEGRVDRVVSHDQEAEVLVRTGEVIWTVSVVGSAIEALGLNPGAEVRMIIKSRSCRVLRDKTS